MRRWLNLRKSWARVLTNGSSTRARTRLCTALFGSKAVSEGAFSRSKSSKFTAEAGRLVAEGAKAYKALTSQVKTAVVTPAALVNAGVEVALVAKSAMPSAPCPALLGLALNDDLREALQEEVDSKIDADGKNKGSEAHRSALSAQEKA